MDFWYCSLHGARQMAPTGGATLNSSAANGSELFRAAHHTAEAKDAGDNACNEHPNSFVSRRSGKEPGNVGAERVHGLNSKDNEHNSTEEQNNR